MSNDIPSSQLPLNGNVLLHDSVLFAKYVSHLKRK